MDGQNDESGCAMIKIKESDGIGIICNRVRLDRIGK